MTQKQTRFYELWVGIIEGEADIFGWDEYCRYNTQQQAYKAMTDWRNHYADKLTPLRIVRIDLAKYPGDADDQTFIDETGMSIDAWTEKTRAELLCLEFEPEDEPC